MGGRAEHPLIAGKIHGVRSWTLAIRAGEPRLFSLFAEEVWESGGQATEARCSVEGRGPRREQVPHRNCGCGLYAWHPWGIGPGFPSFGDLDEGTCIAVVEAWGRVELHEDGFRARYARPIVLILPRQAICTEHELTVRRVAEVHRAEVAVLDGADADHLLLRRSRARDDRGGGEGPGAARRPGRGGRRGRR